ncbi:hypothetical protein EOA38_33685 [Mesorhizobium sp. M1E.F.Ca.ET.041.01.1.1]|nr:hypothetical protein EOA38_33685 [Mesorhizobium sp. M1E.F.Ca.ET.041.01.1.1]
MRESSRAGRVRRRRPFSRAGAAPHLPAGILSPYSDGERGAVIAGFRQLPTSQEGRRGCGQPLLPVTIRGEVPGRAMRGSADFDSWCAQRQSWKLSLD